MAIGAPSISSVAADVQLASILTDVADSINYVIDGFQGATGAAVNALMGTSSYVFSINQATITNTASILQTILNRLYVGGSTLTVGFLNAANVFLPNPFDAALSDVVNGFLSAGSILTGGASALISPLATTALTTINALGSGLRISVSSTRRKPWTA